MAAAAFLVILIVLVALGACAVGGIILLLRARSGKAYASCGACGYDVSGAIRRDAGRDDLVVSLQCPECGASLTESGIVAPARRRPGRMALGIALLAIPFLCGSGLVVSFVMQRSAVDAARAQAIIVQQQALAQQQAALAQQQAAEASDAADEDEDDGEGEGDVSPDGDP